MNIFFLDWDPKKCAKETLDKHIIKQILESTQLLYSVYHLCDPEKLITCPYTPYKLTHKNHPCSIWVRESLSNYLYLCELGLALGEEYTYRYGKTHKSIEVIQWCLSNRPNIKDIGFTTPPLAMPDEYKVDSVVESYRNYYKGAKSTIVSWKNREKPVWFLEKKELDLCYD